MYQTELGRRFRIAREARGLSQQAAADVIGVLRTAVTQMESGNRAVSTLELTKLAKLYRRPVGYFLEEAAPADEEDMLVVLHRAAPGLEQNTAVNKQVVRCLDLCSEGVVLKALLGLAPRSGPPGYNTRSPRSAGEAIVQGQQVAQDERRRLGIGNSPIPRVSELISAQGIWASRLTLPDEMSGLFMRHPSIGLAILVNASHARGRKRFSYAHEYAHALMDRDHKIAVSSTDNSAELVEKRANAFAASFLMPRDGVYEVLRNLDKGLPSRQRQMIFDVASDEQIEAESRPVPRSQRVTYKDVALVAYHFGVSYRAALYRLQNLRHVSQPESVGLLGHEDYGRRYLKALCISDDDTLEQEQQYWDRELRSEVAHLAMEAYRRDQISEGRLLELSMSLSIPGDTLLELAEVARGE